MNRTLNTTGHAYLFKNFLRGKNCTLYDDNGNSYLDLESGVWCTSVGHSHPRINRIIRKHSSKLMHSGYCYQHPVVEQTAEQILEISGIRDGKCLFLNSGSEAVDMGVKIARSLYPDKKILTLSDSYLGACSSLDTSEKNWIRLDWLKGQPLSSIPFDSIAALVFEPGSSSGLVRFPPEELISEIIYMVRKHGGIVIANEVTTGMGRTGEWFGCNHYECNPDIVTMGKGLGNGYPVSCTAICDSVVNRLDLQSFHHAQSHQNDPLGAAVAGEVIQIIRDENLLEQCRMKGDLLRNNLEQLRKEYGIIRDVRGRGLMTAVEFEQQKNVSYAETVNQSLLEEKIILVRRPGLEVFRIDPALTITENELRHFISTLTRIIKGLA